ncbi:hypothetical protein ILFOPFJJ_06964 [Ensifer psoraleae]|nr:hypothetical protein [Sinorhizobium psoraleae]
MRGMHYYDVLPSEDRPQTFMINGVLYTAVRRRPKLIHVFPTTGKR